MEADIKCIKECAAVLPGFSVKQRLDHNPDGTCQVLLPKHLTEGQPYRYRAEHVQRVSIDRDVEPYRVHPGNVLFVSRGAHNQTVLIETVPEPSIATSTFYILRVADGTDPGYLAWCLNQPGVQAAIGQIRTGAGTPIVPRKDLGAILIPVPPLDRQNQIAHLAGLMSRERALRAQLLDETERCHRLLGQQLLDRLAAD